MEIDRIVDVISTLEDKNYETLREATRASTKWLDCVLECIVQNPNKNGWETADEAIATHMDAIMMIESLEEEQEAESQ